MPAKIETKEISTDILIVGGGGGGAMAAIKAKQAGADALVVTKGRYPSGNTSVAAWGFAAAIGHADPRDNPQIHFEDGIKAGEGLNNRKLMRAWTTGIIDLLKEMDSWGDLPVEREGDKFKQRIMPPHTYPRLITQENHTGRAVMQCLSSRSKKLGIQALENTTIGGILKNGDVVSGAWGINYDTGEIIFIKAKAVILATGGLGHLFPITDQNVKTITGEGYTMAFRAGAEVIGMEFTNFMLGVCYPEQMRGLRGGTQGLLGKGGARLYNALGERFMKRRYPGEAEEITGIRLVQAVGHEIAEGHASAHGGVYLDCSGVTPEAKEARRDLWDAAKRAGVDLDYQPIEIAPAPHDQTGGIKIDETANTGVPGLYAVGEAAGGVWGASRFPGGAVSDAMVFGAIATQQAIDYGKKLKAPTLDKKQVSDVQNKIQSWLSEKKGGIAASEVQKEVQAVAFKYLNSGRNEAGLKKALEEVGRIEREDLPKMTAWDDDPKKRASNLSDAIEVDGQLELARIIATSSMCRKDSRGGVQGGHYRSDYPERDNANWIKNVILKRNKDGSISTRTAPPVMED